MLFRPSAVRATLLLATIVAVLLGVLTLPAHGHVHVVGTFPADGETLAGSPTELVVAFDRAIEIPPNGLQLFVDDVEVPLDPFVADEGREARAIVPDEGQVPGTHRVAFRVVSPDAHVVAGDFTYVVEEPVSDGEPDTSGQESEASADTDDPIDGPTMDGTNDSNAPENDDAASGEAAQAGTPGPTTQAMDPSADAGGNTGLLTVLGVLVIAGIIAVLLLRPRSARDSA